MNNLKQEQARRFPNLPFHELGSLVERPLFVKPESRALIKFSDAARRAT